jgi:hypothetical protein
MDTSCDDEWIKEKLRLLHADDPMQSDDQRHEALESVGPRMTGPQTKQARPSVKVARIDEPERAWLGSARLIGLALAGTCAIGHRGTRHGDDDCAPRALSALRQGAGVNPPAGDCQASVPRHRHARST